MSKHAYLIIADSNIEQLKILVSLLDDIRNDIYIMIDKKSSLCNEKKIMGKYSKVYYLDSINIYWGNYSIIDAELRLFEEASKVGYAYYHLISGKDLPIHSQNYIHNFFDNHPAKEFIEFEQSSLKAVKDKVKPHLFRKYYNEGIRNKKSNIPPMIRVIISAYRHMESILLKPMFNGIDFKKIKTGSQWVSVDNDLVTLIVNNKNLIKNIFNKGKVVDELFIPTLLSYNPSFFDKVSDLNEYDKSPINPYSNLRYIKKEAVDAHPQLLTLRNMDDLLKARDDGYLFARKFDINQDKKIVDKVVNIVKREK